MLRGRGRPGIALAAVSVPSERDLVRGLARVGSATATARRRGARLVVFPESALGGHVHEPRAGEAPLGPPPALTRTQVTELLVPLAGDAVLVVGFTEDAPGGPYAAAACVDGQGPLGFHRKVHVPRGERHHFSAGDGFAAFDTSVGRLGLLLCYDKLFAEASLALARDGAEVIACGSAWPACRLRPARRLADDREVRHHDLVDRARAVEHQVAWVAANLCGRQGRLRYGGQATVVDPDGVVRARTGTRGGLALAPLNPQAEVLALRAEIDHLADRAPDAYAERLPR